MVRHHTIFTNIHSMFETKLICNSPFRALAETHGVDEPLIYYSRFYTMKLDHPIINYRTNIIWNWRETKSSMKEPVGHVKQLSNFTAAFTHFTFLILKWLLGRSVVGVPDGNIFVWQYLQQTTDSCVLFFCVGLFGLAGIQKEWT